MQATRSEAGAFEYDPPLQVMSLVNHGTRTDAKVNAVRYAREACAASYPCKGVITPIR